MIQEWKVKSFGSDPNEAVVRADLLETYLNSTAKEGWNHETFLQNGNITTVISYRWSGESDDETEKDDKGLA